MSGSSQPSVCVQAKALSADAVLHVCRSICLLVYHMRVLAPTAMIWKLLAQVSQFRLQRACLVLKLAKLASVEC